MTLDGIDFAALPRWMARGACVGARDPDLWFPAAGQSPEPALVICARCPVRDECLAWALEMDEDYGVWGGTTEKERKALKKARRGAAA